MDKEAADKLRGMVRRVTIKSVDDSQETQRATIEVADGIERADVEVLQPYGFQSNAPKDGALAIALPVGGDQGDIVLLPIGNPGKRMGNLPEGAVGVVNEHGDGLVVTPDGVATLKVASAFVIKVGGVTVTISAAGHATEGGQVTHNEKDIGDTHKHGGIVPGPGDTDVPV